MLDKSPTALVIHLLEKRGKGEVKETYVGICEEPS